MANYSSHVTHTAPDEFLRPQYRQSRTSPPRAFVERRARGGGFMQAPPWVCVDDERYWMRLSVTFESRISSPTGVVSDKRQKYDCVKTVSPIRLGSIGT
jgi:hypothetical protein